VRVACFLYTATATIPIAHKALQSEEDGSQIIEAMFQSALNAP
jgi:hypothetical protein